MNLQTINPEVVGLTQILEESPMTEQEQKELIETETSIKASFLGRMERDLAIGEGLLLISRHKLYRGKDGGRTWEQYLKEESPRLTGNPDPMNVTTARHLRAFYRFRNEILPEANVRLPLPTAPYQLRSLVGTISENPSLAVEVWKAACSAAKMGGKTLVPSNAIVQDQYLKTRSQKQLEVRSNQQQKKKESDIESFKKYNRDIQDKKDQTTTPEIKAWELEKTDSSLDAVSLCKQISAACDNAKETLLTLKFSIYNLIHKEGSQVLKDLKNVDAGVYSVSNLESQINELQKELDQLTDLVINEYDPKEDKPLDISAMPRRND
tara:strand:- start:1084 stop:2052 length:969 start_codon:yes stop_codon:yes gene_type:complete